MNKGLHRFALLVTFATFILILAGALVTSNGAGLAAPDWPLSYGQFFPPMVGNLFYEHGHRLIASTVGLLVIALNIYLWRSEPRRWVRRLGLVALGVVITQGLLGGATVLLQLPLAVSTAHATLAQIFFCLTVSIAIFTAPEWRQTRERVEDGKGMSLPVWCGAATIAIVVQRFAIRPVGINICRRNCSSHTSLVLPP
jgi:cytochrome c oxidase assembly protein subunit 15